MKTISSEAIIRLLEQGASAAWMMSRVDNPGCPGSEESYEREAKDLSEMANLLKEGHSITQLGFEANELKVETDDVISIFNNMCVISNEHGKIKGEYPFESGIDKLTIVRKVT